mmetsp:Transcript_3340/g.10484  ORF Transcript_3340/g.10484 Transcript_3340/m.10484 type:complete len:205 (-) Transcript_3340:151-765(-)
MGGDLCMHPRIRASAVLSAVVTTSMVFRTRTHGHTQTRQTMHTRNEHAPRPALTSLARAHLCLGKMHRSTCWLRGVWPEMRATRCVATKPSHLRLSWTPTRAPGTVAAPAGSDGPLPRCWPRWARWRYRCPRCRRRCHRTWEPLATRRRAAGLAATASSGDPRALRRGRRQWQQRRQLHRAGLERLHLRVPVPPTLQDRGRGPP